MGRLAAIPVDRIKPNPQNPRVVLGELEELAASITARGLLQPVIVTRNPGDQHFTILAGHRRVAALKLLGATKVPCVIREDMLPDEELAAMLVENGQRANLDPIEEARALAKLHDQGKTHREIGDMIGRSDAHVGSRIALLRLPSDVLEEVRARQVPIVAANKMAREVNPAAKKVARGKAAVGRGWHFDHNHPLAPAAKARCVRLKHSSGRRLTGGQACGQCWEAVIRADAIEGDPK